VDLVPNGLAYTGGDAASLHVGDRIRVRFTFTLPLGDLPPRAVLQDEIKSAYYDARHDPDNPLSKTRPLAVFQGLTAPVVVSLNLAPGPPFLPYGEMLLEVVENPLPVAVLLVALRVVLAVLFAYGIIVAGISVTETIRSAGESVQEGVRAGARTAIPLLLVGGALLLLWKAR